MSAMRVMGVSAVAVGIGLAGLLGAGVANAAPAPSPVAGPMFSEHGPGIRLDHHDRKKVLREDKHELKHHRQDVVPARSYR